jgi:hypothetical protein
MFNELHATTTIGKQSSRTIISQVLHSCTKTQVTIGTFLSLLATRGSLRASFKPKKNCSSTLLQWVTYSNLNTLPSLFAEIFDCFQQGRCKCVLWELISSRVVFRILSDGLELDFSVNYVQSKSLAATNNSIRSWARVGQLHINGLGECTRWVTKEFDDAAFDSLVFSPSSHDSSVIDAVDDDFVNTCCFECVLSFHVTWNLSCGSGRCESSRKAHDDYISPYS